MKINRAYLAAAIALAVSGCAAQQVIPPAPPPPRPTALRPAPVAPPVAASIDWRDLPQTPGAWTYEATPGGSLARFGLPGAAPLATLRCDRTRATVTLSRAGTADSPVPASVTTSSGTQPLSALPAGAATLDIGFAAHDRTLDAMAFSRGRFLIEINGLPTLNVPAWAEVGRVVEDCR